MLNLGRFLTPVIYPKPTLNQESITFDIPYIYKNAIRVWRKKCQWRKFLKTVGTPPTFPAGRGIVTCAGGIMYLTCAWINIRILRNHGCKLPIELWCCRNEITPAMVKELGKFDVECKDIQQVTQQPIAHWQIKPFAIIHSKFAEVLFLDADNVCVREPSSLFDEPEYRKYGAVFWPDNNFTPKDNPIWRIVGIPYRRSLEQESGQMVINKSKTWEPLQLAAFFNLQSHYYFRILYGDKDTFRFAWLALNAPFVMIPTEVGQCGYCDKLGRFRSVTMVQHDFQTSILFLHRNTVKWNMTKSRERLWQEIRRLKSPQHIRRYRWNPIHGGHPMEMVGDFEVTACDPQITELEERCLYYLRELRSSEVYQDFLVSLAFNR